MPVPRARQITLTATERRRGTKLASSHTAPYQQVIRARIVLDAARGHSNAQICRRRGVSVDTVRCWRGRYADEGVAGLADRPLRRRISSTQRILASRVTEADFPPHYALNRPE